MRATLLAGVTIGAIYLVGSAAMAQTTPADPATAPATPTEPAAPAEMAPAVAPAEAAPVASAPAPASVPKGTPIVVEITDLVSSRTVHNDDTFNLKLAEPVMLNGVAVIPAGTPGKGVVIDAAPPGMGGKPAKLVLAARYLEFQGKQIPIKALNLGLRARDNTSEAVLMGTALGTVGGIIGLTIKGGQMEVQPGTKAGAKLGIDFIPDSTAAPLPPQDNAVESSSATQNSQ